MPLTWSPSALVSGAHDQDSSENGSPGSLAFPSPGFRWSDEGGRWDGPEAVTFARKEEGACEDAP